MGFSLPCLSQSLSFILLLFHFHSTISSPLSSNYSSSSSHLCAHRQSLSLLQFKLSFSIQSSPFWFARNYQYDQYPKTGSWKEGTDCCLWDGVTCDLKTGHVTALDLSCSMLYGTLLPNNSLFSLHHLQQLDLSFNDFNTSHISSRFGQFSNLTHLNLSGSDLAGQVPSEISHLSKMVSLDLSWNYDLVSVEPISFDKLVRNLTKLRELHLSWVNMSLVVPDSLMNLSSSLSSLKLDDCGLQGKLPSSMGKFKHLQYLGLGGNNLTGPIPHDFDQLTELVSLDLSDNVYLSLEPISFDKLVRNLTKLRELDLSWVDMSLLVPDSLRNLSSSLSSLKLIYCRLQGIHSLSNLIQLTYLDLSGNNLNGQIVSSLGNLTQLTYLVISGNNLNSQITSSLGNLTQLTYLDLSGNNLISQIPSSLGNLTQLTFLDLSNNNLSGQIPSSLGNLVHLRSLFLGSNKFMGQVPDSLGSLVNLSDLDLSNNQLVGSIHSQLNTLSNLQSLYLSNNLFNGTIPSSFFALPSLQNLDLHNNNLIGNISEFQHNSLRFLDLSNNHLHGPIPSSISNQENLTALILASNSKLTGEISSSICKLRCLLVLDLSNNSLSGSTPLCLGNFSNMLSVLHLGMNKLQGIIPSIFSKDNSLEYLNLNGNELEGKIPLSIINCTMLEVIDLGNNKIEDTFPYFLETLPELQVLVLKSNKLQGFVKGPIAYNSFSILRILDISDNNFSGPLPTGYFNSLEAMMASDQNMVYMGTTNYTGYDYSIEMTWKGVEIEFTKIRSTIKVLDLSNNNFTGEIPKAIGKLKALHQLNLSYNFLTGHIQSSLENLNNLESLDLSSNCWWEKPLVVALNHSEGIKHTVLLQEQKLTIN
ncbi:receptor-like protein 6 [Populus trichocarpa]|uniref:receptor-like protein 6 n=1 Tax=Populus trichocarpa TaxID=3694 RepID=UPI002279E51C|nr:receptor-like protein 6 [Populus trichocarpa]